MALKEDKAKADITTNLLVSSNHISEAHILAKEDTVICGMQLAKDVFKYLDPKVKFTAHVKDGQKVKKSTCLATIVGRTRILLAAERTALNFLGHLSGIANTTQAYVKAIKPYKVQILDTRKTAPGLRHLEKYAVKCGGGVNHRIDLNEMVLVKDNHIEAHQPHLSIADIIKLLKKRTKKEIIIEVDTLKQFQEALLAQADIILLDNMTTAQMRKAVWKTKKVSSGRRPLLEASGGVNLKTIKNIAKTGVDRISIGALTHSYKGSNISMEVVNR